MHTGYKYTFFFIVLLCAGLLQTALAQNNQQATAKWQGYDRVDITLNGRKGYYVKPAKPLPGNPWVWRASFPDWHTEIDTDLLNRGFHVAFVQVDDMYGSPSAMMVWDEFYKYLTDSVGLAKRVALEAVSRGGLYALGWAKRNPDKVSCIYAETPVYDFKSWPGGKGKGPGDAGAWKQLKEVYGFTEEQALNYKDNPIDNLEGLASYKVPILNMVGPNDELLPPTENSLLFAPRYVSFGGPVTTFPVTEGPQALQGHHVPMKRFKQWADFIYYNSYPIKSVLPYADYYNLRGGLQTLGKAVKVNKKATVAFMGGSITFNPGWRDKVCVYLKERFPDTKFKFIAAGIPSLGSLPHVFRLQRDVLDSGKIDLLFLEAAVNDRVNGTDSLTQVRDLEGIIRHVKRANPAMDIVMMSFADPDKTADYNAGKTPVEIKNHELVAGHYNLPSINIAKLVRDKINNKEFDWNDDFKDLHPSPFGQELYFATIKDMLQNYFAKPVIQSAKAKNLPKQLNKASFVNGNYYSIKNAKYDNNWKLVDNWTPENKQDTRPGFVKVPVLMSNTPGATLTLPFKGNAIGIAIVSGADAGKIDYSVDGVAFKTLDLYTPWSGMLHLPWYLLLAADLKDGNHTLNIKINPDKNSGSRGSACRIVNFLINQ
ncbi:MAG: SGNH/GDSL hydrolase family protein [Sphingobacteriaceae bacterium]|nr:MAG: SGNH/GDSL hydrolase family protein [Sphingobacteriaceae bacterium]